MKTVRRFRRTIPSICAILLVVTGCTGSKPELTSPSQPKQSADVSPMFSDVAEKAGIRLKLGHSGGGPLNILEVIGSGCAFLDFDGDNHLDALIVAPDRVHLWRNLGNGSFEDVSSQAMPEPRPGSHLLGCAVADYDDDGRTDLYVSGYGSSILYHNEGAKFRDVTEGSGLHPAGPYDWRTSACWADVDADGKLDLYVARYVEFTPQSQQLCEQTAQAGGIVKTSCGPDNYPAQKGSLYRNLGNGKFADITKSAGLDDTRGKGLGALFCDFNDDGRPDLYAANDKQPCDLFKNLGGGKFKNVGLEAGVAFSVDGHKQAGMGVDWGDYDNDGRFDLLVATFSGEPRSLYQNDGGGRFTDKSYESGIGEHTLRTLAFGAAWADLTNDGLLDAVFTNGHVFDEANKLDRDDSFRQPSQLFINRGDGKFQEAAEEAGEGLRRKIVGRGIAVGDYDADGKVDLLIVDSEGSPLLLHNEFKTSDHWLAVQCIGKNGAAGTRVTVETDSGKQIGEARAGGSYLSTNSTTFHFGLGKASSVKKITVQSPGGAKLISGPYAADRLITIRLPVSK